MKKKTQKIESNNILDDDHNLFSLLFVVKKKVNCI